MRRRGLATLWFLSLGISLLAFVAPVLFALPTTPRSSPWMPSRAGARPSAGAQAGAGCIAS